MKTLLQRISEFLRREPARILPVELSYPVLFANGRDDDGPALQAFYEGRPFVWDGRVCLPSNGPKVLDGLALRVSQNSLLFVRDDKVVARLGYDFGEALVIRPIEPMRQLCRCAVVFGCPVQP